MLSTRRMLRAAQHLMDDIVIVDDRAEQLKLLSLLLTELRPTATIHTLERGDAVLPFLQEHRADLLMLDIYLRDMDGVAVMRALRATGAWPQLRIVAVSGTSQSRESLIEAGFDDVLAKPYTFDDLQGLLNRYDPQGDRGA